MFGNSQIEITPDGVALEETLLAIGRAAYAVSVPVGLGYRDNHETPPEEVSFTRYLTRENLTRTKKTHWLLRWLIGDDVEHYKGNVTGIHLDYVNGRQCKAIAGSTKDGKIIFTSFSEEKISMEKFIEELKSSLIGVELKPA